MINIGESCRRRFQAVLFLRLDGVDFLFTTPLPRRQRVFDLSLYLIRNRDYVVSEVDPIIVTRRERTVLK